LPPGSTLRGRPEGGSLAQQGADLIPVARDALREARKTFDRLNKTMPLVDETLREYRDLGKVMRDVMPTFGKAGDELRELAKSTRETIPDVRRTADELQLTARNWGVVGERVNVLLGTNEQKLNKAVDQLNDTLKRVAATFSDENQKNLSETLKNVRDGSTRLDGIMRNTDEVLANMKQATKPLAERSDRITRNLDEGTEKLNLLLGDVRGLFRGFGQGDGTLQRLLSDPSLYNHLNEAACMVTRMLPRLDRALGDLEIFADKLARHPEALGLGGVVRPGTGLKEGPSSTSWKGGPGH
jgi:ABC-type transporter Mla subunit MlaD